MQSISILGAGWLGLPLGKHLASKNFSVKGSTTRKEKFEQIQENGLQPFLIKLGEEIAGEHIEAFFQANILVLNVPPGGRRNPNVENDHPQQIEAVLAKAKEGGMTKIIFVSSTSVYGNNNAIVEENTTPNPSTGSGRALVKVEKMLRANPHFEITILRMGGLVGGDRKAGRFFAGKKDIPNGLAPINFVHRADCIGVISAVIEQQVWGETFNVVADEHPTRQLFYQVQAEKQGFEVPTFLEEKTSYKTVSNEKVKRILKYQFQYANPLDF
jgi:nucleoside-diphosphate-sugar epimerase